jgi:Uma2 family endonuclease
MNIQARLPTTADEFLRWNEGREGKREFVRGKVVEMMINVTRNHVEIATNLVQAIRRQMDRKRFSVGSADFGVRTNEGVRYPDVFVDAKTAGAKATDLAAVEPLLVAEILSPSSYGRDFVEKLSDYRSVTSLFYYLIVSHEEPRLWLASRDAEDWAKPVEIAGMDEIVRLDRLNMTLSVAEIYDGVELRGMAQ